jgi:hypothetical protein
MLSKSLFSRLFSRCLVGSFLLTVACGGGGETPRMRLAGLETDRAEALIRFVYERCPFKKEAEVAALVLTAEHQEPSAGFQERFKNLGVRFIPYRQIQAVRLADVTRIVEAKAGPNGRALVLLLQVTEISKNPDGTYAAVAAWAYKDSLSRKEYVLKPKGEGAAGFEISEGRVLEEK